MKISHWLLIVCLTASLACSATAFANDAPASDDSIREMLAITNAHKLIDTIKLQINSLVAAAQQQAVQGKPLTPEKQAIIDRMQTRMQAALDEMLNWQTLEAMYVRIYRASFTQDELDGMMAFYRTAAGQALINKMPLVTQNLMSEVQGQMKPMQEKIQQIQREATQELKDLPAK
ncbi:MAG TPA: DUF2059 domain-containing protein [Steroidobacteraceae bacterium]